MVFALVRDVRALIRIDRCRLLLALACALAGMLSPVAVHADGPAAVPAPTADHAFAPPTSVFFIQRNKNRNEVHYRLDVGDDCLPMGETPLSPYWRRLEDGPEVVKPISMLQRRAYGVDRQSVADGRVTVVLRALPGRSIDIATRRGEEGCEAAATIEIDGERVRFERAYVFATEGLLLPKVEYIELFGREEDGSRVTERIAAD